MHILYEIERLSTSGGIERILTDKANYMVDVWGWDVTIVVLLDDSGVNPFFKLSPKVRIEYLNLKSTGILMCLQSVWKLNAVIRRLKPDVYVTFQTIGALSCLLRTHATPTIYEAHGIRTCMQHPLAMSIAERFADAIAVLTKGNADRYSKAKKTMVIANFTNIEVKKPTDYSLRHCVAVGRLDFEKNFSRLISIWAKVHPQHPDWVLDIYGDGPEYSLLQLQIDRLELSACVFLHGSTDNVVSAYLSGSINLLTSRYEGFGLVIVEAAKCGLSTIAFDCPDGPAALINDSCNGFLVPYDDDQAFIDKLSCLMENEDLRREMGHKAMETSQRFSQECIMPRWKELFLQL